MIIIDWNQAIITAMYTALEPKDINEFNLRALILSTIKDITKKFKSKYGSEVVIACDCYTTSYWRKSYFQYYKSDRKRLRDSSKYDWSIIFPIHNKIKQELIDNSMYKVLDIDTAEADDIIGTLVQQYHNVEKILIISSDKDFLQLQKYSNVYQYSIKNKTLIEDNNPARGLKEKIIRGDRNDGIPNILSADDVFVTNTRQKSIISDKLEQWLNQSPEEFCNEEMLRNYSRNNVLINLDCIPDSLKNIILYKYIETKHQTRQKFLSYLIENRMSEFISDISDF